MKSNLWKHALAASCLLATALVVPAGPLQRGDVGNDPVWLVHLDCDALRQTAIGKHILSEMEKPEAKKKLAAFQAIFSFDLREGLRGLTLYGTSSKSDDGVLLAYADIDQERLTTLAEGTTEHRSTAHGKHTIHSWIDDKKPGKQRVYSAILATKLVIFAQKEGRVAEALDVLDHAKPNLNSSTVFTRLGAGANHPFLIGAARKLELPGSDPNAAVLKQSKMVWLSVGESQRQMEAALTLEAESEDVAKQIESVGRGLVGLLALQQDKPEATKLAQALALQQEGPAVTVKFSLPADDVVGMMKARSAKKAADQ